MSEPIVMERRFDAPPQALWRAWTEADRLIGWLCEAATVEPEPGGRYELFWEPATPERNSTLGCRVTRVVPGQQIAFDWRGPVQFHDVMNSEPFPTHVTVRIDPSGDGCLVTLEHAGWGTGPEWDAARDWHDKVWTGALAGLAEQLR